MANGSTLRMDPQLLYSNAASLDGYSQELENTLDILDKSMNNIFNNSEGETIIAIQEQYTALYALFGRFIQMMGATATVLRNTADNMNQVDVALAKQIASSIN
ncbi:MAG: WXG100 family type VII secretion target [Lachnospiraceae bacterium]|nr:WXG100 family type VII secretion target [Lachnospiraceae bacterium]